MINLIIALGVPMFAAVFAAGFFTAAFFVEMGLQKIEAWRHLPQWLITSMIFGSGINAGVIALGAFLARGERHANRG